MSLKVKPRRGSVHVPKTTQYGTKKEHHTASHGHGTMQGFHHLASPKRKHATHQGAAKRSK
jgi:hypothetical protein